MQMISKKKLISKKLVCIVGTILIIAFVLTLICNLWVLISQYKKIYSSASDIPDDSYDAIVVLGCEVKQDGSLSQMLSDRMDTAIEVYMAGKCSTLVCSGDRSQNYDEVDHMKEYAISQGVKQEDIICDYKGFSTYETIWNCSNRLNLERILIITQDYHLYRALFLAESFNIEAVGVRADKHRFAKQFIFSSREYLARIKDIAFSFIKPQPQEV